MTDYRGIPTAICPSCNGDIFNIKAKFDPVDYEIGLYFLDGSCVKCGALITAPTPMDHPNNMRGER